MRLKQSSGQPDGNTDPVVHLFEKTEITREHVLDDPRVDLVEITKSSHDPTEEDDDQIRSVALDAEIVQWNDLVLGIGQAHHAFSVQVSVRVDVAARENELVLGFQFHF